MSAFKFKRTWQEAIRNASAKLRAESSQERFRDAAEAHKGALESIAAAYVDGKIDEETFTSELAIAKRDLRADLSHGSADRQSASTAATTFFDVIERGARKSATGAR